MTRFSTLKWATVAICAWATLGAVFSSAARAADDKIEINNAWNEGRYEALQETSISYVESSNRKVLTRTQTRATFDWFVESTPLRADGVRVLKLRAGRVMIRLQNDGADVAYFDSGNSLRGDGLIQGVFANLLKSEFTVELKDGKVVKIDGCEAFMKTLPAGESKDEKIFIANIQSVATPDNIAQVFEPLSYPLPGKPVGVGDKWTTETPFALPIVGEKTLVLDCSLKAVARREAKADVAAESILDVDLTEGASATIKIEIDGKYDLNDGVANEFSSRAVADFELPRKNKDGEEIVVKAVGLIRNKLTVAKR